VEDWVVKERWLNIKLLVDVNGSDLCKEMKNDSYAKHIKCVLLAHHLTCEKVLHLGQNMGAKILDLLEAEGNVIRRMGQWNPSVFYNSYSSKLPMGPIRKLAGYEEGSNKVYFNTRTIIYPTDLLRQSTPIGKWCYEGYNSLLGRIEETEENPSTAISFLRFMVDLNDVFLQDCAAMLVLHPERANHPLFHCVQVFDMPEWTAYVSTMKSAIESENNPLDANLESVIPGIQQWHNANTQSITCLSGKVEQLTDAVTKDSEDIQEQCRDQQRQSADTLMGVARTLLVSANGGDITLKEIEKGIEKELAIKQSTPTATTPALATTNEHEEGKYYLTDQHKSLYDLWDEWHGLGSFYDIHGGPAGRDATSGTKWRKHLDGQHYSRTKRIVVAIKCYYEQNRLKMEEGITQLDEWYQSTNRSVAKFVCECQCKGLLGTKNSQGRTKTLPASPNAAAPTAD